MKKGYKAKPKTVLSWFKRGDGQGEGRDYKPFLKVRDGIGRGIRVKGLKTERIHHLLSWTEYRLFVLLEQLRAVADIREQYPLRPWTSTVRIAKEFAICHSKYKHSITPIVMTTDFFVIFDRSYPISRVAISVKWSSDIDPEKPESRRTLEKQLIEAEYWKRRGVPWRIVTEQDIPDVRFRNLRLIRPSVAARELDRLSDRMVEFVDAFQAVWIPERPLNDMLDRISSSLGIEGGHCFALFSRAAWTELLDVDLNSELIDMLKPLRRAPKDLNTISRGMILNVC